MNMKRLLSAITLMAAAVLTGCGGGSSGGAASAGAAPNILFVIMDDVGVDQMKSFGYGGNTPPSMPNMDAVASAGVRFRNTWSMPECTPGRAAMFVGRFPLRNNIYAALGPYDLANSQVSSDEMTAPKLLKQANYESGMFGKFHLAGPDNNQDGNSTPLKLGWDYFYGWIRGGPVSIDTTAGGVAAEGTYGCGFVPGAEVHFPQPIVIDRRWMQQRGEFEAALQGTAEHPHTAWQLRPDALGSASGIRGQRQIAGAVADARRDQRWRMADQEKLHSMPR